MSAHKGNKYNEIWDLESTKQFFKDVVEYIETNTNCRSLSEAVVEVGEYEELISYLLNKYPDTVFKSIKRAKDIVKNRLVKQGLDGEANSTMAIFILKNNHNMTDKQQTDLTTNGKELNNTQEVKITIVTNEDEGD